MIAQSLNRAYWERAWIYQEAAMAANGVVWTWKRELDLSKFAKAVRFYAQAESEVVRRFETRLEIVARGEKEDPPVVSLLNLAQ